MAYNKQELFDTIIKTIGTPTDLKSNRLVFFEDIFSHVSISSSTFYDKFPRESKFYKKIAHALKLNQIAIKVALRGKLFKSNSPAANIALYKLMGTREECERLNGQPVTVNNHTTTNNKISSKEVKKVLSAIEKLSKNSKQKPVEIVNGMTGHVSLKRTETND